MMPPGAGVLVLGTAQDAGVPHVGCACKNCEAARRDPALVRRPASIAIRSSMGRVLLVDATPAIELQLAELLRCFGTLRPDALLLTHAHMGHYIGLAHLGTEGLNVSSLSVHGTKRMHRFLRENRPWSHLIERNQIVFHELDAGQSFAMDDVRIDAVDSPHRGEDTDTLGFVVRGPTKSLAYVPDIDAWNDEWLSIIRRVDIALIDGTFYDDTELPGRDVSTIPHPRVADTVTMLAGCDTDVRFIHLNHSNGLLHADDCARPLLPQGFAVCNEGEFHRV